MYQNRTLLLLIKGHKVGLDHFLILHKRMSFFKCLELYIQFATSPLLSEPQWSTLEQRSFSHWQMQSWWYSVVFYCTQWAFKYKFFNKKKKEWRYCFHKTPRLAPTPILQWACSLNYTLKALTFSVRNLALAVGTQCSLRKSIMSK